MTNPATTSLLDRANLDRDSVRHELARGLSGAITSEGTAASITAIRAAWGNLNAIAKV